MTTTESQIELDLTAKLADLKYTHRPDIRDRESLKQNFRKQFEDLNRVVTDVEFKRLMEQRVTDDVFAASKHRRERNSFERDDV